MKKLMLNLMNVLLKLINNMLKRRNNQSIYKIVNQIRV